MESCFGHRRSSEQRTTASALRREKIINYKNMRIQIWFFGQNWLVRPAIGTLRLAENQENSCGVGADT